MTAALVWPQFLDLLIHKKQLLGLSSSEAYNWIKCRARQNHWSRHETWNENWPCFFRQCNNLSQIPLIFSALLLHNLPIQSVPNGKNPIKLFFKQKYHIIEAANAIFGDLEIICGMLMNNCDISVTSSQTEQNSKCLESQIRFVWTQRRTSPSLSLFFFSLEV